MSEEKVESTTTTNEQKNGGNAPASTPAKKTKPRASKPKAKTQPKPQKQEETSSGFSSRRVWPD